MTVSRFNADLPKRGFNVTSTNCNITASATAPGLQSTWFPDCRQQRRYKSTTPKAASTIHHSPRIKFSLHPCALVAVPQIHKILPDTGPTKPHTSCVSGGLCVLRQVTGTNGETPTLVGVSFCLAASVGAPQPIPIRDSTKPQQAAKPSKIRDLNFIASAPVAPMRWCERSKRYLVKSLDRNTTGRSAWACSSKNFRDARSSITSRNRIN